MHRFVRISRNPLLTTIHYRSVYYDIPRNFPNRTLSSSSSSGGISTIETVKNIMKREGTIMKNGLLLLPRQVKVLYYLLGKRWEKSPSTYDTSFSSPLPSPSTTTTTLSTYRYTSRELRVIDRTTKDLIKSIPWVPFLALVPGSLVVFILAATKLPVVLPSTFSIARYQYNTTNGSTDNDISSKMYNTPTYNQYKDIFLNLLKTSGLSDTSSSSSSSSTDRSSNPLPNSKDILDKLSYNELLHLDETIHKTINYNNHQISSSSSSSSSELLSVPYDIMTTNHDSLSSTSNTNSSSSTDSSKVVKDRLIRYFDRLGLDDMLIQDEVALQLWKPFSSSLSSTSTVASRKRGEGNNNNIGTSAELIDSCYGRNLVDTVNTQHYGHNNNHHHNDTNSYTWDNYYDMLKVWLELREKYHAVTLWRVTLPPK